MVGQLCAINLEDQKNSKLLLFYTTGGRTKVQSRPYWHKIQKLQNPISMFPLISNVSLFLSIVLLLCNAFTLKWESQELNLQSSNFWMSRVAQAPWNPYLLNACIQPWICSASFKVLWPAIPLVSVTRRSRNTARAFEFIYVEEDSDMSKRVQSVGP